MQKQRVVSWLSQHNFPHGMIFFSEGLVHDPLRQKTIFLRNLIQEVHLKDRPSDINWAVNLSYKACDTFCSVPCSDPSTCFLCVTLLQAPSVVALDCAASKCISPTDYFLSYQCHIKINSAYGSMKDISVYNMLGLSPSQIYIVGRPSKKYQNQCQVSLICVS